MQLEETGKLLINKIKLKEEYVIFYIEKDNKINKYKIYYDTYDSFNFKEGDELTFNELNEIFIKDKKETIKKYIISLIIKKPYSKNDIKKKCYKKFYDNDIDIDSIIIELENEGIIDDKEYVLTYLDYFKTSNYGKYYIINYFRNNNIDPSLYKDIVFEDSDELLKAKNYMQSIKNKYVSSNFAKQKRKISEEMLRKGFDLGVINSILNELNIDPIEENLKLKKEYKRIKNKFIKNNSKIDNNKLISVLVNKGYRYDDILNLINSEEEKDNRD